jgi:O-antigen ligase
MPPSGVSQETNPIRTAGLKLALVFIFLRITGLHELIAAKLGSNLFILYWFAIPALLCLLFSGGVSRLFRETTVRLWMAFAGWLLLAVLTSDWPGGSLQVAATFIRTELPVLFLIAGLALTWSDCSKLLNILAIAAFTNIFLAFCFPGEAGATGRFEVAADVAMSNANDFAALMLLLLPFLLLFLLMPGRFFGSRALTLACLSYGIYLILHTGSRGAMIGLATTVLFSLAKLPLMQRVWTVASIAVVCCVMLVAVPASILSRAASAFSVGGVLSSSDSSSTLFTSDDQSSAADASAESRWYLFKTSLLFTAQHPIWGVGPGQFANHEGLSAAAQGVHGSWHETHNSYTQASSEDGVPAFILLIAALVLTYRSLSRNYRKSRSLPPTPHTKKISLALFCVLISFVAFCCASLFLSLVYEFYFPLLSGLAIALNHALENDSQALTEDGVQVEAGFSPTLA